MSDDRQIYEEPTDTRYTYFSRFNNILPPYLMDQLIGIQPQKRRSFLLQQKYLVPLTFSYSLLQFFAQFSVNVVVLHVIKKFWQTIGSQDPIIFGLIFLVFSVSYGLFRWTQAKNTTTIREEVFFRTIVDGSSVLFSLIVVFDINHYWRSWF